jgi:hypothetical protein
MIKLKVTTKKDGTEVAWYKDFLGRRVRISMRAQTGGLDWNRTREMMGLGLYWIQLMLDRTKDGIGSDDAPMAALGFGKQKQRYSKSGRRMVNYGSKQSYAAFKMRVGLQPIRDLRGVGGVVKSVDSGGSKRYRRSGTVASRALTRGRGHMLDDIRVIYADDTRCQIGISNSASRVKGLANEQRAPWWGCSPSDVQKMFTEMARVMKMTLYDLAASIGITGAAQLLDARKWVGRVQSLGRRAA